MENEVRWRRDFQIIVGKERRGRGESWLVVEYLQMMYREAAIEN